MNDILLSLDCFVIINNKLYTCFSAEFCGGYCETSQRLRSAQHLYVTFVFIFKLDEVCEKPAFVD